MGVLVAALAVTGCIMCMIGGIMLLVAAFRTGVGWGLAVLFLPVANMVFLFVHWTEAKNAFLVQVLGLLLFFSGFGVSFATGASTMQSAWKSIPLEPIASSGGRVSLSDMQAAFDQFEEGDEEDVVDTEGAYVGLTLKEVKKMLGRPKGQLKVGKKVLLVYPDVELLSTDGETITRQGDRTGR